MKTKSGSHSGLDAFIQAKKADLQISCDSPFKLVHKLQLNLG